MIGDFMDKKIETFINEYIPEYIPDKNKEELKEELTCHIYDRIEYYTAIGCSEEESFQNALKDFGDEKEIKEQIKKDLGRIHIPWSLANFFSVSIPITIVLILVIHFLTPCLLNLNDIVWFIAIPLVIWGIVLLLKRAKRPNKILKSVIAIILVVPHFLFAFWGHFLWSTKLYTTLNKDESLSSYYDFMIDEDYPGELQCLLPHPKDIGSPIDANKFTFTEETAFSEPCYITWIFEYSPAEYEEIKEKLNNEIVYRYGYVEYDGQWINDEYYPGWIKYDCSFGAYGFDFKTLQIPEETEFYRIDEDYDFDNYWETDYWAFIGTNDDTNEIAFIRLSPYHFTPSFDEAFIKDDCGWRYFYYLTKF